MTAAPPNGERPTHGDECELACPWCGEMMWMADDDRWARGITLEAEDECEHCGKAFMLSADTSVYTTARRKAAQERR